jgi:predicted ATP-grasp superfamily ATP-dependent carboligase
MRVTKAKAWPAGSREELYERYARAAALVGPEQVIVQEFVPGDGKHQFSYCAFRTGGRSLGVMVARRRRQHPPDFGRASTYVETMEIPLIEELSERFLDAIDYEGLVEVEFKYDARTSEFKLLDVNARTWGYHSLGSAAGVDFAYMQYAHSIGEEVVPARARWGVRWVRLATDIPTGFVEIGGRRLSALNYARSVFHADAEAVFARDDPLPALAELALIPYLAAKRGY